jgi:UDP-N-acetylglucosamine 2-epimerase (non-hydrolysing)
MEQHGLAEELKTSSLIALPPAGYLEMLGLMQSARLVLTDSGGIQEETTALGIPCLTFRENTERPVTVTHGTNQLLGVNPRRTGRAVDDVLAGRCPAGRMPPLWDGQAAERILNILAPRVASGTPGGLETQAEVA